MGILLRKLRNALSLTLLTAKTFLRDESQTFHVMGKSMEGELDAIGGFCSNLALLELRLDQFSHELNKEERSAVSTAQPKRLIPWTKSPFKLLSNLTNRICLHRLS